MAWRYWQWWQSMFIFWEGKVNSFIIEVTEQDQTWELKVVHVYFRFVSFFVYVLGVCVCECVSF